MNKRLFGISLLLIIASFSYGQLTFDGWSQGYIGVYSYSGADMSGAITLNIQYTGTDLYEPNWKVSVEVVTPFEQNKNKRLTDKIKLELSSVNESGNNPRKIQSVENIVQPVIPVRIQDYTKVYLVPSSLTELYYSSQYGGYYNLQILLNFILEGGSYLSNMKNSTFDGEMLFRLHNQDDVVIGTYSCPFRVQIHNLPGTPPVEEEYSISFSSEATNASIEYNSISDYVNGKSVTFLNGLTVSATTGYEISVRSVDANFTSETGETLPLEIVKLKLSGRDGDSGLTELSTNKKVVLQSQSTNGLSVNYNVTYSTSSNDTRLYNVPSKNYSTQLMYEISPL
ncbi:MAG: hypothetical protein M0Q52_07490 [Lascolabacillus sp.]|nr:hypothetical protein [Lascolabacillus sp.]